MNEGQGQAVGALTLQRTNLVFEHCRACPGAFMIKQGLKTSVPLNRDTCSADVRNHFCAVAQSNGHPLLDRPLIGPDIHPSIGENIQGPSLIKVPTGYPTKWAITILLRRPQRTLHPTCLR